MNIANEQRNDVSGAMAFAGDYSKKSHMQRSHNAKHLPELVARVCKAYPITTRLRILDIGCGDGAATVQFYELLLQAGYSHIVIDAIDISQQQIATANAQVKQHHLPITFIQQDALTLDVKNVYHVVFSLFTFHWINDKQKLSTNVARALVDNGILFFLAVPNLEDFFTLRQRYLEYLKADKKWQQFFQDFELIPFDTLEAYQQKFFFNSLFSSAALMCHEEILQQTFNIFGEFISSWLPELRQLRQALQVLGMTEEYPGLEAEFLAGLIARFPMRNMSFVSARGVSKDSENVYFQQEYATFFGYAKKTVPVSVPAPAIDHVVTTYAGGEFTSQH